MCVKACSKLGSDQISRFSSQEVEEHACGVGFIKRRPDLHIYERGGTTSLRDRRHGVETTTVIPWELCEVVKSRSMGKQCHCGGSVLRTWETSLLRRDSCLMPRT